MQIDKIISSKVNDSNIILKDVQGLELINFDDEYILIIKCIDKDRTIGGFKTLYESELAKTFIETMIALSREEDAPKGFDSDILEVGEDFVHEVLKQVSINCLMMEDS